MNGFLRMSVRIIIGKWIDRYAIYVSLDHSKIILVRNIHVASDEIIYILQTIIDDNLYNI